MFSRRSQSPFVAGIFRWLKKPPLTRLPFSSSLGAQIPNDTCRSLHLSSRLYTCYFEPILGNAVLVDSRPEAKSSKQDQRSRLSQLWLPSGGIAARVDEDAHSKLVRGGFLRQAHSGIFHMLPLGYRVQCKIEKLIDKHMKRIGASRLDLSSISSEHLWRKSGRLLRKSSELFHFKDRKSTAYLLSPTHEEEITTLVSSVVKSFKELPIRLYQISRKYRDEMRPRHGLLRSREFVMKDLYTFDESTQLALATYEEVREAYIALFNELKIPYLVAEADSGDMGGNLSHEFHFLTSHGEDQVVNCGGCNYVANVEVAEATTLAPIADQTRSDWRFISPEQAEQHIGSLDAAFTVWRGLSRDRLTLVNVWHPIERASRIEKSSPAAPAEINIHTVKCIVPDLDPAVENAGSLWLQNLKIARPRKDIRRSSRPAIINLLDYRLPASLLDEASSGDQSLPIWPDLPELWSSDIRSSVHMKHPVSKKPLNFLRFRSGDTCPRCGKDQLNVQTAIELGHTFFLGSRYSEPFNAAVILPSGRCSSSGLSPRNEKLGKSSLIQMGCHGIGVSRMIGAVAESLADAKGLNWPRAIAPYEVVVVPSQENAQAAVSVYDTIIAYGQGLTHDLIDAVLDDRARTFPWKMRDADLIGYPIIVVVGKRWQSNKSCEVQCRRLDIQSQVPLEELGSFVRDLLVRL